MWVQTNYTTYQGNHPTQGQNQMVIQEHSKKNCLYTKAPSDRDPRETTTPEPPSQLVNQGGWMKQTCQSKRYREDNYPFQVMGQRPNLLKLKN
jgi:hypothetical protein